MDKMIIEDLTKSGLKPEDVKSLGWYQVMNANELIKLIGFASIDGQDIIQSCKVLAIPYPNIDFARVRLYPPIAGNKYLQPGGIAPKPYILPKVAKLKEKPHKPIIITEGEKKALCLVENGFNAIGLPGVWQFKKDNKFLLSDWVWRSRTVYIAFDNDVTFNNHVLQAEIELALRLYLLGAKVRIMRLPIGDLKGVDDFIVAKDKEAFNKLTEKATDVFHSYSSQDYKEILNTIKRFVDNKLTNDGELETIIINFAKALKIKKAAIEKDLKIEKRDTVSESIVEELEPYNDEPVDGLELLREVETILKNYVYMPGEYYLMLSTYIMFTYLVDIFPIAPMLLITSPTKRCGKTTLLSVLNALVHRGLVASNITPSAVFRVIENYHPTLLLDEADASLSENEELRGIINSGHTKESAFVIRTGDKSQGFEPQRFNTFGAKIIAMIGLPNDKKGTWLDRSIVIRMERKPREIRLKRQLFTFYEQQRNLRAKIIRLANDNRDAIANLYTEILNTISDTLPAINNDRKLDNYSPILAIAKHLKILDRLISDINTIEGITEEDDVSVQILTDIKEIFNNIDDTKIFSKDLCEKLNKLEDRSYSDYRHGKGINPVGLARMLKPFGIKTINARIGNIVGKCYNIDMFDKSFKLYLPKTEVSKSNTATMASGQGKMVVSEGNIEQFFTFQNNEKMALGQDCSVVAFQNPKNDIDNDLKNSTDDFDDVPF